MEKKQRAERHPAGGAPRRVSRVQPAQAFGGLGGSEQAAVATLSTLGTAQSHSRTQRLKNSSEAGFSPDHKMLRYSPLRPLKDKAQAPGWLRPAESPLPTR